MAINPIGLTAEQLKENYGQFIHEHLYLLETKDLISRVEILEGRGQTPTNPSGTVATSGDITLTWTAPPATPKHAAAYVIHYGPVNNSNPRAAIYMGYSKTPTWTLEAADIPVPNASGDKIYFWIQSFTKDTTITGTDIEKAAYLNNNGWGSEWSAPTIATVKQEVTHGSSKKTGVGFKII